MKRIIIVILLIILSTMESIVAQKYNLKIKGYIQTDGSRATCRHFFRIEKKLNNGQKQLIDEIYLARKKNTIFTVDVDKDYQISEIKDLSNLVFYAARGRKSWGSCKTYGHSYQEYVINSVCDKYTIRNIFKGNNDPLTNDNQLEISLTPIIYLEQNVNDLIGFNNNLNVNLPYNSKGFDSSTYNWQYQVVASGPINNNAWVNMPPHTNANGNSSFTVKPSSFLPEDVIGKKVYFRIITCNSQESRNIISYRITKSAPHILNVEKSDISCYDEVDGSVKINFDRGLTLNEKLSITIEDLDRFEDDFDGNPIYETVWSSSNVVFAPDNSYTFSKTIGKGLREGRFRVVLFGGGIIAYNGDPWNTYTEAPSHTINFTINKPDPVAFTTTQTNVWCNGGSDGTITIKANGGDYEKKYKYLLREASDTSPIQESDWKEFTNLATPSGTYPNVVFEATEIITGKPAGNYTVKIKDANNCIAKEIVRDGGGAIIGLGSEITQPVAITEPAEPVKIDFVYEKQPTAFGFSDGQIRAQITGGTPLAGNRYNFTWKHANGTTWTSFSDDNSDPSQGWFLTLENAIQGTYTLTVTDANHSNAINKEGCTVVNASYTLNQPPKLTLRIEETNPISCNGSNIYSDPASDGELTAIASGGVPFNPLIMGKYAYKYTWKKKNNAGVYQVLAGENGNTLKNQAAGEYAVNIEDANGIIIGTYINNTLTNPTDVAYTLNEPPLLQINYAKQDVFCYQGNDGAISTVITGGTGAYAISWNTGETTKNIANLVAGVYTIEVTDERGCMATQIITIDEPENPIGISYNFFEPTFAGATNGWIEATVTGGTPLNDGSYTYIWTDANGVNLAPQVTTQANASSYTFKLNDIGEGTYTLTIQDKNYPPATNKVNCTVVESEFTIDDPEPLLATVNLKTPISCNSANIYGDPFSDGVLEVIAQGGVKLQPHENSGLPYYYTWKKETSPGVWTLLATQTTNIASGLDAGNYAVNIEDANGIILGIYEHNVLVTPTDVIYNFEEPTLVELSFEKQDVYCYEGSDAWVKAIVKGGIPPYVIQWEDGTSVAQRNNLPKGEYSVAITDARGCQVAGTIEIKQPQAPISINFSKFATPTTGGAVDGWIEAQIQGGTAYANGSYAYYWQDEFGTILNAQTTTSMVAGTFQIRLANIKKGNYYLTIQDANYISATTKEGCTTTQNEFILYDPIEAIITVEKPISCNQNNNFNNPFADGKLKATITGGLPFSSGQSYTYYWKKKNASGVYEDIDQNTPIASNLATGNYALNVADSRGVVIGVYESLNLIYPTDVLYNFEEPELLTLALSATEISCDTGNNGTATVAISGGIPPYSIQWSNGATTPTANNLIAGNHLVFVTDARGCEATGNITINEPGGIEIAITKTNPTCYNGNDGTISLAITGGVAPYKYSWKTGATTTNLTGLKEGTYFFALEDANGCKTFREIKLENPAQIIIDLGTDKTLCKNQEYVLDASIDDLGATYSWISDNGFTSNQKIITVTQGGTYTVTATSSKGCTATDSITITYSNNEIDAEFLISSQAYTNEEIVLFHTSNPKPDTFEWNLPSEAIIIKKEGNTLALRFTKPNTYEIGLSAKVGDCSKEITKKIVIEAAEELPNPGDTENPFILAFTISPNPNTGSFKTTVNLVEPSPISLRIFNMYGELIAKFIPNETLKEYAIPFNIELASGMYMVVLETAKQTQVKRMIVK